MNRYSVSIGQDLSKNMSFSGVTKKNPEQTIHKLCSAMYMPKNLGGKKTEQKLFNGIKIAFERQLKSQITQLQWIEPIYFNGTFRNWLSSRHTTNITLDLTGSDAILMHWPNKYQIKWSFYQVFQQTFLSEFFFLLEKRLQNGLHLLLMYH